MESQSRKGSEEKGELSLRLVCCCQVDLLNTAHCVINNIMKLFALGYGIRIEDVQKKDAIRSITGEKDYF
jgi:hypothetical protein